jgi:3,4-dihydroxy 2-butanone 4-phosphate synthase
MKGWQVMFTGRIDEIGQIDSVIHERIMVRAPKSAGRVLAGGSLNVAGVCVTVEHLADGSATATLSAETRRRTTFDCCVPGQRVNVEPALAAGDPLDGHLVQGHVDGVGKVAGADQWGRGRRVWIRPPDRFLPRVAAKGSIAVDGVSLAVAEVVRDPFSVVLIPATLERTTLAAGDRVNLESDLVARLASARPAAASADVARAIGSLGWAGHISGRRGPRRQSLLRSCSPNAAGTPPSLAHPRCWNGWKSRRCQEMATGTAPAPTCPSIWQQPPGPGSRRPSGLPRSAGWRTRGHARRTSCAQGTCSRWLPGPACSPRGVATPNPRWRCARRPACPVGVCCEVMNPDGAMAGPADLEAAALRWGLPLVDISDLRTWL